MNISKKLLSISLLLSIPVALYTMDKHEIKEDYKPKSELKDLSVSVYVRQTDAAQKTLALAATQTLSSIAKKHANIIEEQNDLAERYKGLIEHLQEIIKEQDQLTDRDTALQSQASKLEEQYGEIKAYLPKELQTSFEEAIGSGKLPLPAQQEQAVSIETSTEKPFWKFW